MDQGQAPYCLRRRKCPRRAQPGGLDAEYSLARSNRPNLSCLDPWIVTLLLEYKESVIKTDGQLGHVLKVLNKPRVCQDAEQEPETILHIGDGLHYIEVVVTGKAIKMTKQSMAESELSGIIGQFIVLQNYRVNFKRATKMEDCQFYLILECFQVMPMKREGKKLQNCNREMSVIQKIKDLWRKGFARETWFNSGQESQSVSQILKDVNQDQLNTLKQTAKDCLNLGTIKLLDSEQLGVYSETKWQLERKQNKMHEDTFTVPAEYLVISAENEAALSQSYISNTPQAAPGGDEDIQEDDRSTVSFFSADSASLEGFSENPWDAVHGITVNTSSDASGTSHGLPQMQQMLLASPAEEASPESNTSTSHLLEPCDNTPRCSSDHAAPSKFPSLFHIQNSEFFIEAANQKPDLVMSTTSGQASELADSPPCGQPLNKSYFHNSVFPFSPARHSNEEGDFSLEPVSENRKDCLSVAHGAKGVTARWKYFETEKYMSAQRKQVPNKGEPSEASIPTCSSNNLEAVGHCSTETVTRTSAPNKRRVNRYLPLKFESTPKKRRLEEIQDELSHVFARCSCRERRLEERSEQEPIGMVTRRKSKQIGIQQKENAKQDGVHLICSTPTPELCAQVQSVRISRALLGWARWVFSNAGKQ